MIIKSSKSILSLFLALMLMLSMAACGDRTAQQSESEPEPSSSSRPVSSEPSSEPDEPGFDLETPELIPLILERKAVNSDVVGWLQSPGTTVDDVVVHYPDDVNEYYLRKTWDKKASNDGCYFADFRNTFDGTANGLSRNTVIYGHSLDLNDDPDADYFSQYKKYWEEDFAIENPYVFFSLEKEELVWEIFSVFFATTDLPYVVPEMTDSEFMALISECNKRSLYIYDVDVTTSDKILTLSTCTYKFSPKSNPYPNKYRFVIMARLVKEGEPYKELASLQTNPSPKEP